MTTPEKLLIKIIDEYLHKSKPSSEVVAIIQQAKTEWCLTQRINCLSEISDEIVKKHNLQLSDIQILVLNAPEPK